MCVKCGTPIQGANHPSDPIYYLTCSCARRAFDRVMQRQKVDMLETTQPRVVPV